MIGQKSQAVVTVESSDRVEGGRRPLPANAMFVLFGPTDKAKTVWMENVSTGAVVLLKIGPSARTISATDYHRALAVSGTDDDGTGGFFSLDHYDGEVCVLAVGAAGVVACGRI